MEKPNYSLNNIQTQDRDMAVVSVFSLRLSSESFEERSHTGLGYSCGCNRECSCNGECLFCPCVGNCECNDYHEPPPCNCEGVCHCDDVHHCDDDCRYHGG